MLTCIGLEAMNVFDGFQFQSDDDMKDINIVLEKFETFCIGKTNVTYERYFLTLAYNLSLSHLTHTYQN